MPCICYDPLNKYMHMHNYVLCIGICTCTHLYVYNYVPLQIQDSEEVPVSRALLDALRLQ